MMRSAGSIIARASSGSISTINAAEPFSPANTAVAVLRSPSSGDEASGCTLTRSATLLSPRDLSQLAPCDGVAGAGEKSEAPHSAQNLEPGGFSDPHFGQRLLI